MRILHFAATRPQEYYDYDYDYDSDGDGDDGDGDYDIISSLPDNVCSLIVSFLPANEAVATSVLSQRWRHVWALSLSLDFDFPSFPCKRGHKAAFVDFVDQAMLNFKGEKISKLRISLEGYGGAVPQLEDWILFAGVHQVEELELCLPKGKSLRIPHCLSDCSSVTALTLRMRDYAVSPPSPASFEKLQKLHIVSVSLLGGRFLGELFSSCLLLEELFVGECRINILEIIAPRLRRLTICNCIWIHPVQMRVSAPSLLSFSYFGRSADDHSFEKMSSLDEVKLELSLPSKLCVTAEDCQSCLLKLLSMVGNVTSLTLSSWCTETFCRAPDLHEFVYDNVRYLELAISRTGDSLQALAPLLTSFPYVEELSVAIKPSLILRRAAPATQGRRRTPEVRGKATMLKHLRSVKLERIDESKSGVNLASFLLEHARALEKMTIVPYKDGLEFESFRRKVSKFGRARPNVAIDYCTNADNTKRRSSASRTSRI